MSKFYQYITIIIIFLSQRFSLLAQHIETPQVYVKTSTIVGLNDSYNNNIVNTNFYKLFTSHNDFESQFIIKPYLELISKNKINGIKNIYITKFLVKLDLSNLYTKKIILQVAFEISSSGSNLFECTQNAFQEIRKNKSFITYINSITLFINNYYNHSCDEIREQANVFITENKNLDAIIFLAAIPDTCGCHDKLKELTKKSILKIQNAYCENYLYQAQLAAAIKDFNKAIDFLSLITYDSPCIANAKVLMKEIEKSITPELNNQLNEVKESFDNNLFPINFNKQIKALDKKKLYLNYEIYIGD